jgi:hypothetical protein
MKIPFGRILFYYEIEKIFTFSYLLKIVFCLHACVALEDETCLA